MNQKSKAHHIIISVLAIPVTALIYFIGFLNLGDETLDIIAYKKRHHIQLKLFEKLKLLNPLNRVRVYERKEHKNLSWIEEKPELMLKIRS